MLRRLHIRDFLGITLADIELGGFNVLYGSNGAGKSSVADAILHVLTGAPLRDSTLPEMVRQGARSCEVEVVLAGRDGGRDVSLMRRRARSGGGETFIDGVQVKEKDFATQVQDIVGANLTEIASALRAGALLELKPADLLAVLAGLTGASFDEIAIRTAVGDEVAAAAGRQRLALPKTLDDFALAEQRAVTTRQEQKRAAEAARKELAAIVVDETLAAEAEKAGDLVARATEVRTRRDAALRSQSAQAAHQQGAREEKLRGLRARREDLAAVPVATDNTLAAAKEALKDAEAIVATARFNVSAAEAELAALTKTAEGSRDLPAGADTIERDLADAEADLVTAQRTLDRARADWKAKAGLASTVAAAAVGGCCPTCATKLTKVDADRLQKIADEALTTGTHASDSHKTAEGLLKRRRALADTIKAVRARIDAAGKLPAATAALEQKKAALENAEQGREAAAAKVDAARPGAEAAERYAQAQRDLVLVDAEIRKIESQPTPKPGPHEDVAALDAELTKIEKLHEAKAKLAQRRTIAQRIAAAESTADDANAVAQACGAKGARAELIAGAVGPFLEAANAALAAMLPGWRAEFETEGEPEFWFVRGERRERAAQLSNGERWRALCALQLAAAQLAEFPLAILDNAESVDEVNRMAIKRLAKSRSDKGIQVLMLTCAPAPAPEKVVGINAFVVEAGQVSPIGGKAAA